MPGSPLSRRALLRAGGVGLAATAALSGCDLDPGSSPPAAAPTPDPDQHIVEAARKELRGLLLGLSATANASLIACHRTQLAALQGDPPAPTTRVRPLTPARVLAREQRASERFTRWALTSHNGDLARLLASVAAGIRMQPELRGIR